MYSKNSFGVGEVEKNVSKNTGRSFTKIIAIFE